MSEPIETYGTYAAPAERRRVSFWLQELPFVIVLVLTIGGVAYSSLLDRPLVFYWEFLAMVLALVCISTGWPHAIDNKARIRMIWTQAFHWVAFLVAMSILLLPSVQSVISPAASGLALLTLLALGTFVAGVHVAWQLCFLGVIMGLCVPAIAWLQQSSLVLVLGAIAIAGIALVIWWHRSTAKREPI
jgi:hypothetical protein